MAAEKIIATHPGLADDIPAGKSDMRDLLVTMNQLVKLAKDIGSRVRDLDRGSPIRSPSLAVTAEDAVAGNADELVEAALALIAQHRRQPLFDAPALFDNRNWLLVLELFIADRRNADVSVKEAALALGGATSTALRRLLTLEQLGIITSREDPRDGRRRLVGLSQPATDSIGSYLRACEQTGTGVARLRLRLRMTQTDVPDDSARTEEQVVEHHFAQLQARTISEPISVSQS